MKDYTFWKHGRLARNDSERQSPPQELIKCSKQHDNDSKDDIGRLDIPQGWDTKIKLIVSFGSFLAMFSMSASSASPARFWLLIFTTARSEIRRISAALFQYSCSSVSVRHLQLLRFPYTPSASFLDPCWAPRCPKSSADSMSTSVP